MKNTNQHVPILHGWHEVGVGEKHYSRKYYHITLLYCRLPLFMSHWNILISDFKPHTDKKKEKFNAPDIYICVCVSVCFQPPPPKCCYVHALYSTMWANKLPLLLLVFFSLVIVFFWRISSVKTRIIQRIYKSRTAKLRHTHI